MDYTIIKQLPYTENIFNAVKDNDGYCPCKLQKNDDTKCMCKDFREQKEGECDCGLYFKTDADYLVFTKLGCNRCNILKRELEKCGKTFVESIECYVNSDKADEFIIKNGFPVLVAPNGVQYNYQDAMKILAKNEV